jgi:conjugal transfer ATP-binding protein TraC
MYFSRERKKIVIIDEAWDLMSGGSTAEFIEAGYRRARKYKGAFMSATQGIDDYYKNPAATAALNNSDWVFLLRQKKESIEMLDKLGRLSMDDGMKRMLQSLRTEHGTYSEIFVSSPVGSGIGRLIVDPVSLLLYSSKAEDVNAINAKRCQGLTLRRRSMRCSTNGDSGEPQSDPGQRADKPRQRGSSSPRTTHGMAPMPIQGLRCWMLPRFTG